MSQKRRPSSARWLAEHNADHYVQEARRLGYRLVDHRLELYGLPINE